MLRISALTLALLAVPATTAFAQSATPAPGCHGVQVTDRAGDNASSTPEQDGSPSSDIIAGWIDYDAAANKATANVQVAHLTEGEVDAPYVAVSWEFGFATPAGARYVRAYQDVTGTVKYTWGEPRPITDDQTQPRAGGSTTGALFPGEGGVIQIEIPLADVGATPGSQLKALSIQVRQWVSIPAAVPNTGLPIYSFAPIFDEAAGRGAYTLGPCVAAPTPGTDAGPAPVVVAPAELGVKVKAPKLSARKMRRSRKLRIQLSGTASDLVATLRKGRRTVGSGKLAELDGSGRLTIKLRRKLKKGKYVLTLSGRNAEGREAEGVLRMKVRR